MTTEVNSSVSINELSQCRFHVYLSKYQPSVGQQVKLAVRVARLSVVTWRKLYGANNRHHKLVQRHVVKQFHLCTHIHFIALSTNLRQQASMFGRTLGQALDTMCRMSACLYRM